MQSIASRNGKRRRNRHERVGNDRNNRIQVAMVDTPHTWGNRSNGNIRQGGIDMKRNELLTTLGAMAIAGISNIIVWSVVLTILG